MTPFNKIGLLLLIVAYGLLIPGLTQPVLHIVTTADKEQMSIIGKEAILSSDAIPNFLLPMAMDVLNQVQVKGTLVVHDQAQSILEVARELWQVNNYLVAFLIIFFSVFIPLVKLLFIAFALFLKNANTANWLVKGNSALSKWSMSDVLVMAILISFLSIKASAGSSALVTTEITLQNGFYYFLGFCLVSILAGQLLAHRKIIS